MEQKLEFLEEYERWRSEKKLSGTDLSPQAFLIDRAKEQALQTLIEIQEEAVHVGTDDEGELIGYARWVIGKLNDL